MKGHASGWQPEAFQAAERRYLRAFRQLELSGPQTWASSVMRRLRRRVREAEKEKLKKLYEQLSANEHRSALPFGRSFDTHGAASSGEQEVFTLNSSTIMQITTNVCELSFALPKIWVRLACSFVRAILERKVLRNWGCFSL